MKHTVSHLTLLTAEDDCVRRTGQKGLQYISKCAKGNGRGLILFIIFHFIMFFQWRGLYNIKKFVLKWQFATAALL
jgi:hypothetical protein